MRFCQPHWDKMRAAVKDRNMQSLVSDSGEKMISKMERQVNGEDTTDVFDPLMEMHWLILNNLPVQVSLMEGCPLCNADRLHKRNCKGLPCQVTDFEWMIDRSADDALNHWKELTK